MEEGFPVTEPPPILSPSDAAEWRKPDNPQISPDGARIAFVLKEMAQPDEHRRSTIWMVDRHSHRVRQFTSGPYADTAPRWSPDGSQLTFVSDRKEAGKGLLYVMPADGGEAQLLAEWKGGVSEPRWSPDGRWIGFIGVDPETEEEEQRKKERRDEVVADRDFKFGRLYVVPAEGGEPRRVSPEGDFHVAAYHWSPDSARLLALAVRSPQADDRFYGPSRLVIYAVEGEAVEVLQIEKGMDQPIWSPDGKTVAYRAAAGRVQTHDAIWIAPSSGGEPRLLTPAYEGSIFSIAWSVDSSEIRFVAYRDLRGALQAVKIEGGEIRDLLPDELPAGSFEGDLSVSADGNHFALVRSFSHEPPNVWAGTFEESIRRVTWLNERLASLSYVRATPVEWESSGGACIRGLLYLPPDHEEGKRHPLIVHVHGGPASLWSDRFMANWHDWAQPLAMRGYAVLCPNPRGSIGRGPAFTDAEVNEMGGKELADVLFGVDKVIALGFADPERLGIGGWSHGGYLTSWTITQTDRFHGAVVGAGVVNMLSDQGENDIPQFNDDYFDQTVYENPLNYWNRSPLAHVAKVRTPTLILHGEKDERVTWPQGQELYRALKRVGVETQFVTYPREPHGIAERAHQIDLLERVLAWFDKYVKGERTGASV